MATTVFEDKLREYISNVEKVSHGYYISNGVYHQNLEPVDINYFVNAVRTCKAMFSAAFDNRESLIAKNTIKNEAFWNDLKRQKKRFDSIMLQQLEYDSIKNNADEIIAEINSGNQQVAAQLQKASDYNLLKLPIVFFKIKNENEKVSGFIDLYNRLAEHGNFEAIKSVEDIDIVENNISSQDEILSWFSSKEEFKLEEKQKQDLQIITDKNAIETERQNAISAANSEAQKAMEEAKRAQEEVLKLMEEMQKKYGL
ncbi:hypothetical protein Q2T40_09300 [Winogradskyella maritima]|uniref:Uncharacterized protein n=1 Tax=Winogradskyella maritima TaxID=1517766 RepID=A0ABV8AM31_9FLAO|nr:hypothetical protein [Winogradskyella maritima]